MVNFFLKLFIYPGALLLADAFSPVINYSNVWQMVYTGIFAGTIGYLLDNLILKRAGSGMAALIDGAVGGLVVYYSRFFFRGLYLNALGALLAEVLLALSEYLTHRLIIGERRLQPMK
jgi:hypothetical protein